MNEQTTACPSCGHQNPPSSKFCASCGGKIEKKSDPLIGKTVNNRFRIQKRITSTPLSVDYLATHLKSEKKVLLKIFKQRVVKETTLSESLKENLALLKSISHPNIARIYDIGPAGNSFYIAQKYVPGVSLKDLIAKKGTLSHKMACTIAAQLAASLDAAHTAGIIHGAMKPSNIIVDKDGRVFLTDLGIAGIETEADFPERTAEYLSPEQAAGETYDGRTDIYSLGMILYELLTGHSPYRSNNWETTISYILNRRPTPIEQIRPDLPAAIVSLIRRSTARDRLQRYRSMSDFAAALREAAKAEPRKVGPTKAAIAAGAATTPLTQPSATSPYGTTLSTGDSSTTPLASSPIDNTPASTIVTSNSSTSYTPPPPPAIARIPSWLILSITTAIIFLIGYGSVKMCGGPAVPISSTGHYYEEGTLSGTGDSYDFTVNAGMYDYVEVYFTWPRDLADVWVTVVGEDGYTVLGDFDLDEGEIIQLMGGGTFYLTVYSRDGAATWSAEYYVGDDPFYDPFYGPDTTPFDDDYYGSITPVKPGRYNESGYLTGTGDSYRFVLNAGYDYYVEVLFVYPRGGADFWVKVEGEDGYTILGDFDLDDGEIIQLMGGSTFYLTIYSKAGGGDWSAEYDIDNDSSNPYLY